MTLALDVDPVAVLNELGVTPQAIIEGDRITRFLVEHEIRGADVKALGAEVVERLARLWPEHSEIELRTGQLVEIDFVNEVDVSSKIEGLSPEAIYRLRVYVPKRRMLQGLSGEEDLIWFVTPEAPIALLDEGLTGLSTWLFRDAHRPVTMLITGTDILLEGPYLTIVGGRHLAAWNRAGHPVEPRTNRVVERMREFAATEARWAAPLNVDVTPLHFWLEGKGWENDLGRRLLAQLVVLGVLYTCDRARGLADGALRADFLGRERVVGLTFPPAHEWLDVPAQPTADAIKRLVEWCYDDEPPEAERLWIAERLQLLQVAVVDLLYAVEPERRVPAYVAGLPELATQARSSWKAFLAETLSAHAQEQARLSAAVEEATHNLTDRSAEIAKSVIDSMLAAVAVVVALFIASAFQEDFSAQIFLLGLYVYAAYVVLFPGAFGLASQLGRYRAAKSIYKQERERYRRRLGDDATSEVEGDVVRVAIKRFWWSFGFAAAAYLAVGSAAIFAASAVPPMVASHPVG